MLRTGSLYSSRLVEELYQSELFNLNSTWIFNLNSTWRYNLKLTKNVGVVGDDLLIDSTMDTNNKGSLQILQVESFFKLKIQLELTLEVFLVSTLSNTFPPQIYLWRNYQYPVSEDKSRYFQLDFNLKFHYLFQVESVDIRVRWHKKFGKRWEHPAVHLPILMNLLAELTNIK